MAASSRDEPRAAVSDAACPLCGSEGSTPFHAEASREYRLCPTCALIFVPAAMLPTREEEAERYAQHDNRRDDPRYVAFLRRLADPLRERLVPGARGLDFGSGPVPVLAELLTDAGHPTESYDPFFAPDAALLEGSYDFIACSEVAEHLHDPRAVFERFARMLRPGGTLGVMTRFYGHEAPFAEWWYRRDPTHVCFYREETMRWIAGRHGWTVEFPVLHVTLFGAPRRSVTGSGPGPRRNGER